MRSGNPDVYRPPGAAQKDVAAETSSGYSKVTF
jgi:hypothetical protein